MVLLALALSAQPDSTPGTASQQVAAQSESHPVADSTVAGAQSDSAASQPVRPLTDSTAEADSAGHIRTRLVNQDTAQAPDSLVKAMLRDSILEQHERSKAAYHPVLIDLDSLYNKSFLLPYDLFGADGSGMSAAMRQHPLFIRIPYALESSLNSYLYYGLPYAIGSRDLRGYAPPSATTGSDIAFPAEVQGASWAPGAPVSNRLHPERLVSPEMLMMWENGVFDENILMIRFARPLTRALDIGVFSNYRFLRRQGYNHRRGGMSAFYESIYTRLGLDTAMMSYTGQNPLTQEHIVGSRIRWSEKYGASADLAYYYADLHNDFARSILDTVSGDEFLGWTKRSLYRHSAHGNIENVSIGRLHLNSGISVRSELNRLYPQWTASHKQRGSSVSLGGNIEPFLPLGADSIALRYHFTASNQELYDNSDKVFQEHNIQARYSRSGSTGPIDGNLSINGGYGGMVIDKQTVLEPVWGIGLQAAWRGQRLNAFARRTSAPLALSYTPSLVNEFRADFYHAYGAELAFAYNKYGLLLGCQANSGLSRQSVDRLWPNGTGPYDTPRSVLTVSPMYGRWRGLAVASSWFFSDKRPHVKNHSIVSYLLASSEQIHRLAIDLAFDYWSLRDPVSFGGIDAWNIPIFDLSLKTTVQIQNFRLFYKINNLLNRRQAYIPGYFMPGLTFRWGFNWLLKGW